MGSDKAPWFILQLLETVFGSAPLGSTNLKQVSGVCGIISGYSLNKLGEKSSLQATVLHFHSFFHPYTFQQGKISLQRFKMNTNLMANDQKEIPGMQDNIGGQIPCHKQFQVLSTSYNWYYYLGPSHRLKGQNEQVTIPRQAVWGLSYTVQ